MPRATMESCLLQVRSRQATLLVAPPSVRRRVWVCRPSHVMSPASITLTQNHIPVTNSSPFYFPLLVDLCRCRRVHEIGRHPPCVSSDFRFGMLVANI